MGGIVGFLFALLIYALIKDAVHLFRRLGWLSPPQEPPIFISYRRADEPHLAGRLYERLAARFGKKNVFIDVDSIALGTNFEMVLERSLSRCKALVIIIGRRWLDARDTQGHRRLDNPRDYVRLEIETAFRRNIAVILVLADGASAPSSDNLPDSLSSLSQCYSFDVSHAAFEEGVSRLIDVLKGLTVPAPGTLGGPAGASDVRMKPAIWQGAAPEVRDFLILLRQQGVQLSLTANREGLKFYGEPMRSENVNTYLRLKSQIIELLRSC